jgi:hypothetical protein
MTLVEAVSDVVDGIAGVAQGIPDARARYAAALARVALHGSPEVVKAFSHHQEDATTITPEGRRQLVAAMQQARQELGRQRLEERDLECCFRPVASERGIGKLMTLALTIAAPDLVGEQFDPVQVGAGSIPCSPEISHIVGLNG